MLKQANEEVAGEVCAEGDLTDVSTARKRAQKAAAVSQVASSSDAGRPSAAEGTADKPKAAFKGVFIPDGASVTPEWAKAYAPDVKGCTVNIDTARHYRWVVHSKNKPARPFSHTCTFGKHANAEQQREALLIVVRWAWDVHTSLIGDARPWDLSG